MNILVTLDSNYIFQLEVLLTSICENNRGVKCNLYLLHSRLSDKEIDELYIFCEKLGYDLKSIRITDEMFISAPITDRYPKEMYYRLLAAKFLPKSIDKILYLDPDILVINSLDELWNLDINEFMFAAASHTGKTELANDVNRVRLGVGTDYFNSGVLLFNLKRCRDEIKESDIFRYVAEESSSLILPDQDVLNALYGDKVYPLDDSIWNYDARNYSNYLIRSTGIKNMEWVMENTSILHFCGRNKPWKEGHRGRFGVLYKHYMVRTNRILYQGNSLS